MKGFLRDLGQAALTTVCSETGATLQALLQHRSAGPAERGQSDACGVWGKLSDSARSQRNLARMEGGS